MIGAEPLLTTYTLFWLGVLGAVMGSFLNCAAWRMAHGESILTGHSHCGSCGERLTARDLVPIFSYLFHRGRCRRCGAKIPADCLISELAGALLFLGLGWRCDVTPRLLMWLIFGSICLLLALIDWNTRLLPDKLLLLAAVNRLVFLLVLQEPLKETLVSMLLGACSVSVPLLLLVLLMDRLLGRETMGGGDIKLLFVLGLYMDGLAMCLLLLTACVIGLAAGLALRAKSPERGIPFGPAIVLAWYLVFMFGEPLLTWYRGLLFL